mmetsp:Transcript_3652/g.5034  ORF Transcript_3652/g.5034 Transcript_3652/m.5034 type:complete len:274 (+) Transcript_3652:83-904(+)
MSSFNAPLHHSCAQESTLETGDNANSTLTVEGELFYDVTELDVERVVHASNTSCRNNANLIRRHQRNSHKDTTNENLCREHVSSDYSLTSYPTVKSADCSETLETKSKFKTSDPLVASSSSKMQLDAGNSKMTPQRTKSVCWHNPNVVTHVWYRPIVEASEKADLHYSAKDMLRFKKEYKAAILRSRNFNQDKIDKRKGHPHGASKSQNSQRFHLPHASPITGLINMAANYMVNRENSSSNNKRSLSPRRRSKNLSKGTVAETFVLVDTLYLF